ncbi:hypothetical protein [Actinokineospora cianjurensis]|uniref:DUF3093 family protein n=1 Tax=Actinokineospora cianjurensis TaxID=585224 RepID=A0A421B8M5_9PSEU|nr:hypothetical protein [Actinokineospora cianjurensis]RLK60658.1 hypothetical protein CLV68_1167 [Actinokineospora cianjurensis]
MTDPDEGPVLYAEPGSTWWPVLWGPLFSAVGAGVEAISGPVHWFAWAMVGLVLFAMAAGWVSARRKICRVVLTPAALHQGRESLPVARITSCTGVGTPVGARPLGGGWTVPKKTTELPLELDDGSVVLAWAADPAALVAALAPLVKRPPG